MGESRGEAELLVGVEEEFLLVDRASGLPAPRIDHVIGRAEELAGDQAQAELHRAQIESASTPCRTLAELRTDLLDLRRKLVAAASTRGCAVVASGTYPGEMGPSGRLITRKDRYQDMARANPLLAREQLICGCHIHVSAPDPAVRIRTMNVIRRWLPLLLALSANSPFWEGEDTGFASYRTEVWARWPTAGPIGEFSSVDEYEQLLTSLVDAGVILDEGMAYWDVRPSGRFPTLEIRVADVMVDVDTVVAVAALARALVSTCSADAVAHRPLRPELLRAATWRSATSGLSDTLIDAGSGTAAPARRAIDDLLQMVGPELEARGELGQVTAAVESVFDRGTGADVQRAAFTRRREFEDVVASCTLGDDGMPAPAAG